MEMLNFEMSKNISIEHYLNFQMDIVKIFLSFKEDSIENKINLQPKITTDLKEMIEFEMKLVHVSRILLVCLDHAFHFDTDNQRVE